MSAAALCAMLEDNTVGTVPSGAIQAITDEIWGGSFDREGRQWTQMEFVLNRTRRKGEDDNSHVRLGEAFGVLRSAVNGCGWSWLIRDDERYGHFANMAKELPDGSTARFQHFHKDAAFALIMSLLQAVEMERAYQLSKLRERYS